MDETKCRRKQYYNPKDCIKCPISIRYSIFDYASIKYNQLPKAYYRSNITLTNFTHNARYWISGLSLNARSVSERVPEMGYLVGVNPKTQAEEGVPI